MGEMCAECSAIYDARKMYKSLLEALEMEKPEYREAMKQRFLQEQAKIKSNTNGTGT